MDQQKTGALIRRLRRSRGLTQLALAEALGISDKAVSKWERACGFPDSALLPELAAALGVDTRALLAGDLPENEEMRGNMKKLQFYVCPQCGNILTAAGGAAISCCGRPLEPLAAAKVADDADDAVRLELIDGEYFVSSAHEMSREHYIAFVALLSGDTLILKKLYPEWDLAVRLPRLPHAMLYWYCTKDGLFCKIIR